MSNESQKSEVRSQKTEASTSERLAPSSESQASNGQPLLIEIGCEEIPARFLAAAEADFGERLAAALSNLHLAPAAESAVKTYSTPRRLVAFVPQVLIRQSDRVEETTGPPVKVSIDAAGKPTRAAESFAQKSGVKAKDLIRVTTPKGEYLAARKTVRGRPAANLLSETLPAVFAAIPLPKSMYWTAKAGPRFFRPVRWILALLGEGNSAKVVRFQIAGVKSGKATFGHRASGGRPIQVASFEEYAERLRAARVEIEPAIRSRTIQESSKALLEPSEKLVEDAELETWHVNSAEWPSAIRGGFNEKFLRLPREILITVMRDHQKYFAVEASDGSLRPGFIAILNRQDDPKGMIRAGHERVLRARFTDAQFFWDMDQNVKLAKRWEEGWLERVTYHEKLGSYGDKVRRMEAIARKVCAALESQGKLTAEHRDHVFRAIQLCKCDLTTQMVKEFTELQGVVGGLYAAKQNEKTLVADAIYEHYMPRGLEDKLPWKIGSVVSLADKLDTIVAGFGAGLEPSGSSDPFGLRRAGNGVIRVAAEALPGMDLQKLLPNPTDPAICNFLRERVEYYLTAKEHVRYDTVRAVTRDSFQNWIVPSDSARRAKALEKIRDSADFQALAAAAKRTRNILAKSAQAEDLGGGTDAQVDESRLVEQQERDLFDAYSSLTDGLRAAEAAEDYEAGFRAMAGIRPQVDRFFDKVLVMAEDREVRRNRLRLLTALNRDVFSRFADLSQIESSASTVGAPTKASDG